MNQNLCECNSLANANGIILYLSHHPNCNKFNRELEIKELLMQLIKGIESWAADEDGVHPECWLAYVKACNVCGEFNRPIKDIL